MAHQTPWFWTNQKIKNGNFDQLDPSRPALVLLPGAGYDHRIWQYWLPHLTARGWLVVAVDWPGHGSHSTIPPLDSIAAMADWLVQTVLPPTMVSALHSNVKRPPPVLIGHSMGALVALEIAARYPAALSKLVLLGAALPMKVSEDLLRLVAAEDPTVYEMLAHWSLGTTAQLGEDSLASIWLPGLLQRLLAAVPPQLLHHDLMTCHNYANSKLLGEATLREQQRGQQIRCPVFLLHGEQDLLTPLKAAQPLYEQLLAAQTIHKTACRREIFPGLGHTIMLEAPQASVEVLLSCLG